MRRLYLPQWPEVLDLCVTNTGANVVLGRRAPQYLECLRLLPEREWRFAWRRESGERFSICSGVATFQNEVYASDRTNHRVQVFRLVDGSVVDIFGQGH